MRTLKAVFALLAFLAAIPSMAGTRADHWSGFDFGTGGTPFPSIGGLGIGFNIGDDARISAAVGTFVHWTTYALDSKFFLGYAPWAAYVGAGFAYMTGTAGQYLIWDFQFDHAFIPFLEGGIDFQADMGIHVMFNVAGSAPNGRVIVLPGIAIGWYF